MDNLEEALWILVKGLFVVFAVMGLIAGTTALSGRIFVSIEKKAKEKKKEEKAKKLEQQAQEKALQKSKENGSSKESEGKGDN